MRKRSFLLFTLEFPPFLGGVATYNYHLSVGLAELGYNIDILTCDYIRMKNAQIKLDAELKEKWNIEVIRKKSERGFSLLKWTVILYAFLMKHHHVYSTMLITDIGGQRVSSLLNLKKFALKYFITVHGSEVYNIFDKKYASKGIIKELFPIFKKLANKLYSNSKGVIFVSHYTKRLFFSYFEGKISKTVVIHNGIDSESFKTEDHIENNSKLLENRIDLITISRIDPRKNHKGVINAIASLPEEIREKVNYHIVGKGSYETSLRRLVYRLNLGNTVYFHGNVSEEKKMQLLDSSDVFIMPSKKLQGTVEGLGISFLEAAARGLPLIGGNHGGVPEVIIGGKNGFLVPPSDHTEISKAICAFIKSPQLIYKMGLNSLKCVHNFSRKKMAFETAEFINNLIH